MIDIKDIINYLPYGVKIVNRVNKIVELNISNYTWHKEQGFKLILRPLKDLRVKIQIGEYYMTFIGHICRISELELDLDLDINIGDLIGDTMYVNFYKYSHVIRLLYEFKFDIHNLIESGQAIDINTL